MPTRRVFVLCLMPIVLLAAVTVADAKRKPKQPRIATGPMDDGKLDPFWFGEGLAFREAGEFDYLWVKPDFRLSGQTLHFIDWPEPEFLGEDAADRDDKDHRLARMMARDMATAFEDAFRQKLGSKVQTSMTEGDIRVEGRIVDCSAGSSAAKVLVGFGAGSGNTTVDVKLIDTATGELLVAIHHRVVSGTSWSTTDSKFVKWIGKAAEEIADEGIGEIYADGDPVDR